MDDGEYDIYKNTNTTNENSSLNGEHIAIIRSLVSVYERRFKRFQEEYKLLSDLTELQYGLINKLGITPNNMILSPVENKQTDDDALKNSSDDFSDENSESSKNESGENVNNKKKANSSKQQDKYSLNTQNFLAFLQNENKQSRKNHSFNGIFQKFPIFESALFSKDFSFNIQPICEYIQTLSQEKRQEFYSEIWSSLNNLPYFFNNLFSLHEADSFHFLSELIESTLPHSLNYSHVLLYSYDSKKSLLSIEKQKVKIDHILKDGLISNAIKINQPIFIDRNDPKIQFDDLSIMVKHEKALFIPIADTGIVLAFFDKIGDFTPLDNLIAFSTSSIVNEISLNLQLQTEIKDKVSSYQRMGDIFIELSTISNIKDFMNTMEISLIKAFNCTKFCFFEVSQSSQTFWRFDSDDINSTKPTQFRIGHGIIGYSIAKRSTISLSLPEFSILFDSDSDRPENGAKIDSILACPIFDRKGEVKWSIVLYNKINCESFSQTDVSSIEIFTHQLHSLIESTQKTSKISEKIESKKKLRENADQISDFLTNLSNLEITDISSHVTKLLQETCPVTKTEIYLIDRIQNEIFLMGEDEISVKKIERDSEDPIVKFSQEKDIKETVSEQSQKIFCPLIGSSEKVVGMMVLISSEKNQNFEKRTFSKVSKLQKKLSFFNQSQTTTFSSITNLEVKKKLTSIRRIVGQLVEFITENQKVKQLILIHDRVVDSLFALDKKTIANLYPQIELNFIVKGEKQEETKAHSCLTLNGELIENSVSLISMLNRFPGNCNIFTMKRSNQTVKGEFKNKSDTQISLNMNSFDVFKLNETQISDFLTFLMHEIGIVSYLKFDQVQIQSFIKFAKKYHSNKKFENWQLSIDRIQFLNYFLKYTNLHKKFTDCQKTALFFFLISLNCDPLVSTDSDDDASFAKSKYFLEFGPSFGCGASIFAILSSIPESPFFLMPKEEQNLFFEAVQSLEQINDVDSSLSDDLTVLTALICSFSYLGRDLDVSSNWVKLRFDDEESEFMVDLIKCQLDIELKLFIQPAFSILEKNECKIDAIRKNFVDNLEKLDSFKF